jgi:lysophospholipase L1-like esterase
VREEEAFPALVADGLSRDAAPGRVEWINAGVPGFTSAQGLRYLRRAVLPFHPDIVSIFFGWNDGWRSDLPDAARRPPGRLRSTVESSRVVVLGRRVAGALGRRAGLGGAPADARRTFARVPPDEYEANLLSMSDEIRRAGAIPILITPPAAFGPDRPPDAYFHFGWTVPREELEPTRLRYAEAVRRAAAAHGILLVDCARLVPADPDIFLEDGYHPNSAGHRAIARQIVAAIRDSGFLTERREANHR